MKYLAALSLSLLLFSCSRDSIFELSPTQCMLMTGKGPGQDGAINPYLGQPCIATIKNLGDHPFEVRIQRAETLLYTFVIKKGENNAINLEADQQLYLDTYEAAKAKIRFKEAD